MTSGMMIQGKWMTEREDRDRTGKFNEIPTTFRDRVSIDGSSGFKAAAGRYHLYVALGCPWAHRTLLMREIKGLNDAISLSIVDPIMSDKGWMFSDAPGAIPDSVNHARYLQEIYLKADPKYTGRVTVPVLSLFCHSSQSKMDECSINPQNQRHENRDRQRQLTY
jgi:glutathionyl-hydroquinone reductase